MKYAIVAIVLFVSGCAASPDWSPESVAPKSIEVHFVDRKSWNSSDFIDTDKALIGGAFSGGVADFRGETCHIYFPAHRGIPLNGSCGMSCGIASRVVMWSGTSFSLHIHPQDRP